MACIILLKKNNLFTVHGCSPSRPLHSVLWDVLLTAIESRFCAVPLALGKVITSQGTERVKGF